MPLPHLTEPIIRQHALAESFQRGRDYYQQGAVISLVQRGMTLQAVVEGSQVPSYVIRCTFNPDGSITSYPFAFDFSYSGSQSTKLLEATMESKQYTSILLCCIETISHFP